MITHTTRTVFGATLFAGALVLSQAAFAGRLIMNHDEWTFTEFGFAATPASTTAFAQNLASYMNIDGGACNLLVYSSNFGFTGPSLNTALTGAGCSVAYNTGAFDLATLSAYDGVFLGGSPYSYNAATLTSYMNSGHSVYLAGGTGLIENEGSFWDSFTNAFGLDFASGYNGIGGTKPISSSHPLFAGVQELYFNNGSTVGLFGSDANATIELAFHHWDGTTVGMLGVYDDTRRVETSGAVAVPEPETLALLGIGLVGLGFTRRKSR